MTFSFGVFTGLALLMLQLPSDLLEEIPNEYVKSREFVSPVSGERFTAWVLNDNVPVFDYDYDQCPHGPVNTLAYTVVIDPASGYVDYPETFAHSHWQADEVARIVGEPRFDRSSPPGLPWLGAYPWEALENAAKLAEADKAESIDIANWWLMAGWSVRLDVVFGDNEYDTQVLQVINDMPHGTPDMSDLGSLYDLQLARQWENLLKQDLLIKVSEREADYALAWLYRGRGELVAAQKWVNAAAAGGIDTRYELLHHYLASSIELESSYLTKARDWFIKGWEAGRLDQLSQGPIAYLIAELYRRTGEFEASLEWYDLASERNYGGVSQNLVSRQRSVAANGRGY